jgi:predicted dinucleotide-binding enzyme
MRIAILGSGLMGSALGTAWARAGNAVVFSYSRDQAKLEQLARDAGSGATTSAPNEAVRGAEVVLVSVPWHRLDDALVVAGGPVALSGRIVVSCSLPMRPDDSDLAIGHDTSGAEQLAARLPAAHVIAAFNTIPSELIRPDLQQMPRDERPHVLIMGDAPTAKDVVARLAWDAGFTPVDAGGLRVCRWAEPFGLLVAQLAYTQELGPALGYRFLPERGSGATISRDTPSGSH